MQGSQDPRRQLRRLSLSRSRWKGRVALKQRNILYLRVKVRDLLASREAWKRRALAAESAPPQQTQDPLQGES